MRLIYGFVLCLLQVWSSRALVDCVHGFVGRMQASVDAHFFHVNDTRMCAASHCIKVLVHGAFDDDQVFQQGISSKCAYTGGDRQLCIGSGGCLERQHYDGMVGNFTLCCCESSLCNEPQQEELEKLFVHRRRREPSSATRSISLLFIVILMF